MAELPFESKDEFYRYRLSPLSVKLTSGKTVLLNFETIAYELGIPVTWLAKLLETECGATCKYEKKRQHYILTGTAQLDRLRHIAKTICLSVMKIAYDLHYGIITEFRTAILTCPVCGIPELNFERSKKKLTRTCRACPYTGLVNDLKYPKVIKLMTSTANSS